MFYRLIKPDWAKPFKDIEKQVPNPNFIEEIEGPNVYEGCFDEEYIQKRNDEGYNIYFFPNHPSTNVYTNEKRFLSGKDIDTFNFVFVDMDLKENIYKSKDEFYEKLNQFIIKPTFVVDSGNGVHAYWSVKELTRESYIITQLALLNYFKTDSSVWTVLQLMRVPTSYNTKQYKNYKRSAIVDFLSSGNDYTLSDFPPTIFNLSPEIQNKADNHLARLDGRVQTHLSEDINVDEIPDSFLDLMYNNKQIYELFTNPTEYYGDRSAADMKLVNILYNNNLPKNDAFAALSNTQKALSKGAHRFDYAQLTLDKAYVDRTENKFMTVGQKLKTGVKVNAGDPVHGPEFFDCLHHRWRKKQVCGLIAGPGVGKTTCALKMVKEMIHNNNDDEVFVFFSLEMPEGEIIERWLALVGEDSPLTDRLYVIGNEDDEGDPRYIGLQEIYEYSSDIEKQTGKKIKSIIVDHVGIISRNINMKKKYKFGAQQEQGQYGDSRILSLNTVCTELKTVAKLLDTFMIVLTQTTKEKGVGDLPIQKDGARGISQYEDIMDYIITIWQPLMRIYALTDLRFLAWQYAKIRHKSSKDLIQTNEYKLLTYHMDSGDLTNPTQDEFEQFKVQLPKAIEARENTEKKNVTSYSLSFDSSTLNAVAEQLKNKMVK